MAKSTAYVFYIVPRNFNIRILSRKSINPKFSTNLANPTMDYPNNDQSADEHMLSLEDVNDNDLRSAYVISELDLIKELGINMHSKNGGLIDKGRGMDPNNYLIQKDDVHSDRSSRDSDVIILDDESMEVH